MATEVRLAFAFNGGVSLAIWIGGVTDEVLRCINGGRLAAEGPVGQTPDNPYAAVCAELDVLPKADVLTGTSAGGLNAAFLATAVSHGCADLEAIRRLWLEHGSFDLMMRSATDQTLVSLLAGDENFLPHIEDALGRLAETGTGFRAPDPPVVVHLTSTSLPGQVTTLRDGHATLSSVDHRAEFVFHNDDFDFDADPRALRRMARACRSSASFPGAFEPSAVPADLFEERHTYGLFEDGEETTTPVIDGGVLVNLPAQAALEAILRQPSRERVQRVLALVVPDPGDAIDERVEDPTLGQVLKKALVGIPLSQSLTDFVRELDEHNRDVRARRGARDALFAELGTLPPAEAWRRLAGLGEALLPAYRAVRLAATLDPSRLAGHRGLRLVAREAGLGDLLDVEAAHAPWVPERLSVGDDTWCWGSSAVRRLGSVLITWVNTVAEWADTRTESQLLAIKATIAGARTRADGLAPSAGVLAGLLADELAADGSSLPAAFERACARWPGGTVPPAESIRALNAEIATLADCLRRLVDLARASMDRWPLDQTGRAMRGVVVLADGAAGEPGGLSSLLLCVEVVEGSFAGADPRPDQEIRLVQFTSTGPCDIDPLHRADPREKLAGVELAHFGAFLKGSWRANDWLWGRLDAAQRLLRLLDAAVDNRLSRDGTLEKHTAAVQAAILREELPTLVAELGRDAERGARVTPDAAAFVDAVRRVATTGADGLLDLSAASDDQLRELLRLQLVGAEDISLEAGSNLATVTSIAALRTSARVLHRQGPRALRGPTRVLGATSSLAWRLSRRGWESTGPPR